MNTATRVSPDVSPDVAIDCPPSMLFLSIYIRLNSLVLYTLWYISKTLLDCIVLRVGQPGFIPQCLILSAKVLDCSCTYHGNTRGQAVVPFASVCHYRMGRECCYLTLWLISLIWAPAVEGGRHTSISILRIICYLHLRQLGSCWEGHDTVCMCVVLLS